jgi:hypothetical protein
MCMFCRSLFVRLCFFFWPLCCLSFDLRILITPLVSSNSSYWWEALIAYVIVNLTTIRRSLSIFIWWVLSKKMVYNLYPFDFNLKSLYTFISHQCSLTLILSQCILLFRTNAVTMVMTDLNNSLLIDFYKWVRTQWHLLEWKL